MRKILSIAFLCVSVAAFSQDTTIDKGSGIMYFSGVPGTTPDTTYGAEIAINKLTRELYVYNRDSTAWKKYSAYSQSYADPSGDPTPGPYLHINRADGGLFQWTGAAWSEIATSTDDQTLSKPNSNTIAIEDGNSVTDRSLMQELPGSNIEITTGNRIHFKETGSAFTLYFTEDAFIPDQEVILNRTGLTVLDAQGTDNYSVGLYKDQFYLFDNGTELNLTATSIDGSDLTSFIAGNYEFDVTQSITLADSNKIMAINSSGVFSAVDISSLEGSGSTEVADGVTITGDGSGGSPFTVDTSLIATTQAVIDSISALGTGYVTGPESSTDNAIARFDGTTGKVVQNSAITISDAGAMTLNGGNIALNGEWLSGDGGDEGVFIDSNGKVGIGEDTPAALFEVNSTGAAIVPIASLNIDQSIALATNADNIQAMHLENISSGASAEIRFITVADDNTYMAFTVPSSGNTGTFFGQTKSTGHFIFNVGATRDMYIGTIQNSDLGFGTQNVLRMTVEEDGDVGINEQNPVHKLDVTGDISATGKLISDSGDISLDGSDGLRIDSGSGSPESVVTASPGSLYLDTSGGDLYVKESGTGSTGWTLSTGSIYNTNGTQDDATRTWNIDGNDLYMTNAGTIYLGADNAAFTDYVSIADAGMTANFTGTNTTAYHAINAFGDGSLQSVAENTLNNTRATFWVDDDVSATQQGVRAHWEESATAGDDINLYFGEHYSKKGFWMTGGNSGADISTHYAHMSYNVQDSSFALFDSTLIFSKDAVPVTTSGAKTELEWTGDGTNANPAAVRTAYGTATITGDVDGENSVAVTISPAMPDATYTVFLTVEQETGTFTAAELQAYVRVGKTAGGFTIEVADAIDNGEEIFIHWTAKDN